MEFRSFNELCRDAEPFIFFDAEYANVNVPCIGYELYCIDRKCDCQTVHIMIYEANKGNKLLHLMYGWRHYNYYRQKKFLKSDIKSFIQGSTDPREADSPEKRIILESFRKWINTDKEEKDRIFAEHYRKFKSALANESEEMEELKEIVSLMSMFENMDKLLEDMSYDDIMAMLHKMK